MRLHTPVACASCNGMRKEWIRRESSFDEGNRPNINYKNSSLIAGNGFFVRYYRNPNNTDEDDELDIVTITDSDVLCKEIRYKRKKDFDMRVHVGFNTASVEMAYNDDEDPRDFYVYKRTGLSDWQEFIPPAVPHPECQSKLHLSPEGKYFILWYEPGYKDFIYFYNWDGEKWDNPIPRQRICGRGEAEVYPGNNYVVIRHKGDKRITVFDWDGTTWQRKLMLNVLLNGVI